MTSQVGRGEMDADCYVGKQPATPVHDETFSGASYVNGTSAQVIVVKNILMFLLHPPGAMGAKYI